MAEGPFQFFKRLVQKFHPQTFVVCISSLRFTLAPLNFYKDRIQINCNNEYYLLSMKFLFCKILYSIYYSNNNYRKLKIIHNDNNKNLCHKKITNFNQFNKNCMLSIHCVSFNSISFRPVFVKNIPRLERIIVYS